MNIRYLVNKIDLYNLMIFNLVIFSIIGIIVFGWKETLPQILIAVVGACLLDSLIYYYRKKQFEISKSGIITGFFIALILAEGQAWYIPLTASAIAIIGKHIGDYFAGLIKLRSHIFNPAMVGILLSILIFRTSDGWWGSVYQIAVILLGLFLVYKFKRFGLAISFIVTYFVVLFLLSWIAGGFTGLGDVPISNFRFSDTVPYFFAAFMLLEPKTSPVTKKGRIIYGILSGIVIVLMSYLLGPYAWTAGLLICNLFVPVVNYFTIPKVTEINA